ncbi:MULTISPECIES: iron export ABC transporter permease subunit FetB [Ramlibacter]|uniref:Iron export ABC transporter permease subunit FetB n=1 Tax=Ramlibacter aquaticus TaxID=2780094 RepID=A0ABR9SHH3_9BURK|nr:MULTISPECIES: iron export ABC transporter permease subunit FetB [Ramlibacter]MBE7941805.1 iron export ABC transporter permease subunit FetB [Ramlibacter aquaticus]
MNAQSLSFLDLAVAGLLVLLNAGLSLWLQLGIARSMVVAGLRMVVQLLLVGLVLKTVFELGSPWLVGAVLAAMLASAAWETRSRQQRRFQGHWGYSLGAGTITLATVPVTALAVALLRPTPWFAPQFVVPMFGIVLGNAMSGISVSLNAFNTALVREQRAIEARLALGAPRQLALAGVRRDALKGGIIPLINQMSAAGIITLPGMMTGQVLAGMSPFEAAKYQVFVLFLLAGATAFGAAAAVLGASRRATDARHRLRLDRIAPGG